MSNQSIISIPPNVEDPMVLRRVLSRMTEVIDSIAGARGSAQLNFVGRDEFSTAIDSLEQSLVVLRRKEVGQQTTEIKNVQQAIANLAQALTTLESQVEGNSGSISTNATNISTNTTNISTNAGDITALTLRVEALENA